MIQVIGSLLATVGMQDIIPGIVMCVLGFCLLFVSTDKIWTVAEKWKTIGGERPSKIYDYFF